MKKDNLIFVHRVLNSIANAIIVVFIPLYVLKQTNDINLAMGYLITYTLFVMLFMGIFKKLIQKYGVISILIHFIPTIIAEAILSFCEINIWVLLICSSLMGLAQALYSTPLNLVFTFGDKKTNVGKFQIATNAGKLLFVLVSGYLLSSTIKNSFLILSIASSLFYIASAIPLFFIYRELKENYNKFKEENKIPVKVDKHYILFHIAFGLFQPIMDNVIPLYLYVNNLSFQSVTIFIALVELTKMITNFISQKLVKAHKEVLCVTLSFIVFTMCSVGLIILRQPVVLYVLSCLCSVSFPLTFVPMFKSYCSYLRKTNNIFDGMFNRDIEIFSCRPALYGLSYVGLGLYPTIIGGILAIILMYYNEIKIIKNNQIND